MRMGIKRNGERDTLTRKYKNRYRCRKQLCKGIARACFEYCIEQIDYIRIDTHKDNISMQTAIERFGFRKCGNIYVRDGTERIAYDYLNEVLKLERKKGFRMHLVAEK